MSPGSRATHATLRWRSWSVPELPSADLFRRRSDLLPLEALPRFVKDPASGRPRLARAVVKARNDVDPGPPLVGDGSVDWIWADEMRNGSEGCVAVARN